MRDQHAVALNKELLPGYLIIVSHRWPKWMDECGASCLVWRRQAESYSPVWPKGTPCPKPSPANACTLSWSMDDMLEALMGARAGWNEQIHNTGGHSHTRTHGHTDGDGGGGEGAARRR